MHNEGLPNSCDLDFQRFRQNQTDVMELFQEDLRSRPIDLPTTSSIMPMVLRMIEERVHLEINQLSIMRSVLCTQIDVWSEDINLLRKKQAALP